MGREAVMYLFIVYKILNQKLLNLNKHSGCINICICKVNFLLSNDREKSICLIWRSQYVKNNHPTTVFYAL